MTLALVVAVVSVALGAGLALAPGANARLLGPVRTFALAAALGVVLTHLLPEAFSTLGGWSLVALVGGLLVPGLLHRAADALYKPSPDKPKSVIGLEAGYFGLLVHRVGDGIGLGAYTGLLHAGQSQDDVVVALAAHTVPVVAIVVLAFDSVRGRASAMIRAAGLAGASIIGVLLTGAVPPDIAEQSGAWIAAGVAGLLVHVVTHDLGAEPPKNAVSRGFDLLAAAAGVGISLIGGDVHSHDEVDVIRHRIADALVELSLETGPMLLLGLVAGALLQTFGTSIPSRWLRSRGAIRDALRGTVVGAPLPLCSCSVLPVSSALQKQAAAPALVVAFLVAAPELGIETFALSVRFLGWPYALARLGGALLIAFVAAVTVAKIVGRSPDGSNPPESIAVQDEARPSFSRFVAAFDDLLHHIGAWMVLGVVAAAFLEALLPAEALARLGSPWVELLVVTAVTIPSYICAPSATPLAAVLIVKGLSPGAVLVALLLGPATNVATLAFLKGSYGTKATVGAIAAIVTVAWLLAFGVNAWVPVAPANAAAHADHEHAAFWVAGTVLFCVLLVRSIWLSGARGWLSSLVQSHADGSGHAHSHSHHTHSH